MHPFISLKLTKGSSVFRNEVAVPDDLKHKILAEIRGDDDTAYGPNEKRPSFQRSHKSHAALLEIASSSKSTAEENELIRQIQDSIFGRLKRTRPELQVRVQNGSYTVVKHVDPRASGRSVDNVVSASICYKLYDTVVRMITSGGSGKLRVEKAIMQKVNLCLETGKMYLVLGAPGSGVSDLSLHVRSLYSRENALAHPTHSLFCRC